MCNFDLSHTFQYESRNKIEVNWNISMWSILHAFFQEKVKEKA